MLTQREDVVKQMTFDVDTLINTFSMTLGNWMIHLPYISIHIPTRSISTRLKTILTKQDDTR